MADGRPGRRFDRAILAAAGVGDCPPSISSAGPVRLPGRLVVRAVPRIEAGSPRPVCLARRAAMRRLTAAGTGSSCHCSLVSEATASSNASPNDGRPSRTRSYHCSHGSKCGPLPLHPGAQAIPGFYELFRYLAGPQRSREISSSARPCSIATASARRRRRMILATAAMAAEVRPRPGIGAGGWGIAASSAGGGGDSGRSGSSGGGVDVGDGDGGSLVAAA